MISFPYRPLLVAYLVLLGIPCIEGLKGKQKQKQRGLRRRSLKSDWGGRGRNNKNSFDQEMMLYNMTNDSIEEPARDASAAKGGIRVDDSEDANVSDEEPETEEGTAEAQSSSDEYLAQRSSGDRLPKKSKKSQHNSKKAAKLAKSSDRKSRSNKAHAKLQAPDTMSEDEIPHHEAPGDGGAVSGDEVLRPETSSIEEAEPDDEITEPEEPVDDVKPTAAPSPPTDPPEVPVETPLPVGTTLGPSDSINITESPATVTPEEETGAPTVAESSFRVTDSPTESPVSITEAPTDTPSSSPSTLPSNFPSLVPTTPPSSPPTSAPTDPPTSAPTEPPTNSPEETGPLPAVTPSPTPQVTSAETVPPGETCATDVQITGTFEYNFVFADREPSESEIESLVDATLSYFIDLFREEYGNEVVEISGSVVSNEFDFGPPPVFTITLEAVLPFSDCAPPLNEVNDLLNLSDSQYEQYLTEYVFPIEPAGQHIFVLAARVEFEGSASYL